MIKTDGVDIPRIEYIDPVDGKVSILRVMQDGVQIWPSDTPPVIPNIPTGLVLSEYDEDLVIGWDYTHMYIGEGDNTNLVTLYFTGQDADITSIPAITDWVLDPFNVVNTVTVYADRVELLMNTPFTSASSVTISYSPGVNPLKDIDGYLLTELVDQPLDNLLDRLQIPTGITLREITEPAYTYLLDDYPGAVGWSLRKLKSDALYAVDVRRSDDGVVTTVLLEDEGSITLDSIVTSGETLGEFIGILSGTITKWYDQSGNGVHVIADEFRAPTLIDAGDLLISNGKAAIINMVGRGLRTVGQAISQNTWSIHGVVEPTTLSPSGSSVMLTQHSGVSVSGRTYYAYLTSSNLKSKLFFNNGTSYVGSASMDWALKQATFSNYAASDNYSWSQDGSTPETVISGQSVAPLDTPFNIGCIGNYGSGYTGLYQEFIVYVDDQSANRDGIEANINDYYNAYVVTAEVDAQLIQADNDNVSDTVIEINGVRSSASDTAVANLISRGVTVITK